MTFPSRREDCAKSLGFACRLWDDAKRPEPKRHLKTRLTRAKSSRCSCFVHCAWQDHCSRRPFDTAPSNAHDAELFVAAPTSTRGSTVRASRPRPHEELSEKSFRRRCRGAGKKFLLRVQPARDAGSCRCKSAARRCAAMRSSAAMRSLKGLSRCVAATIRALRRRTVCRVSRGRACDDGDEPSLACNNVADDHGNVARCMIGAREHVACQPRGGRQMRCCPALRK